MENGSLRRERYNGQSASPVVSSPSTLEKVVDSFFSGKRGKSPSQRKGRQLGLATPKGQPYPQTIILHLLALTYATTAAATTIVEGDGGEGVTRRRQRVKITLSLGWLDGRSLRFGGVFFAY